jgi:FtsH-binding integral membrane protein|tara:strand:- start:2843 stop:3457 length:615 start_codon:yes stop_codon:yes gene_type:complete
MFSRFFVLTILHLLFQLSITGATATVLKERKKQLSLSNLIIILFLFIGLMFGMEYTEIPVILRFIMFCVFSVTNGFLVSNYLQNTTADNIKKTVIYTTSIFIAMMFIGMLLLRLKTNIQPLMLFIMIYTIAMLFLGIYTFFLKESNPIQKYKRFGFIGLFSLYVIVDTYFNMQRNFDHDIVRSTLAYYTDIFGLFNNVSALNDE